MRCETCSESEMFVGNSERFGTHLSGLKTVRMGTVAYDIDGKALPVSLRPVFVGRSEAGEYDRIMMARYSATARGSKVCPISGEPL